MQCLFKINGPGFNPRMKKRKKENQKLQNLKKLIKSNINFSGNTHLTQYVHLLSGLSPIITL